MQQQQLTQQGNAGKDSTEYNPTGYASSYANARAKLHRAADASVYASVMDFDDGLDDRGCQCFFLLLILNSSRSRFT
jgi:hypothetical protein